MQNVAVGWQLYSLTGSALDLGLVGLVQFVPTIALTLVVGQGADRCDRRPVVVVCHATEAGPTRSPSSARLAATPSRGATPATCRGPCSPRPGSRSSPASRRPPALLAFLVGVTLDPVPWGLGRGGAAPAGGAFGMSVALPHRPVGRRAGRVLLGGGLVSGFATVVFGASPPLPLSLAALTVLGAS